MTLQAQAKSPRIACSVYCYESVLKGHFQREQGGQPGILYVSQNVSVIIFRLKLS